jgi:hypothetical protein
MRRQVVRRVLGVFFTLCVVLFISDFLIHRHPTFEHGDGENALPLETMHGFYAVYGFVACVTLVLLARVLRKLIMRPEDYYER